MTVTVAQRGIGRPDYSDEIALGQTRPGLTLKYGQSLKIVGATFSALWSPYPTVKAVIGSGLSDVLVDWDTGLDLPITIPAGYVHTLVSYVASFTQVAAIRIYMDTFFISYSGNIAANTLIDVAEVTGLSTSMLDPTAASAHIYSVDVLNNGLANLEGSITFVAILEAVGTEPLRGVTKTVGCKWCKHQWVVPQVTTKINCPKCGQLNIYFDLSNVRELRM